MKPPVTEASPFNTTDAALEAENPGRVTSRRAVTGQPAAAAVLLRKMLYTRSHVSLQTCLSLEPHLLNAQVGDSFVQFLPVWAVIHSTPSLLHPLNF